WLAVKATSTGPDKAKIEQVGRLLEAAEWASVLGAPQLKGELDRLMAPAINGDRLAQAKILWAHGCFDLDEGVAAFMKDGAGKDGFLDDLAEASGPDYRGTLEAVIGKQPGLEGYISGISMIKAANEYITSERSGKLFDYRSSYFSGYQELVRASPNLAGLPKLLEGYNKIVEGFIEDVH